MEKDIILEALHRFQDIVELAQSRKQSVYPTIESDKMLIRLAIKKYNKKLHLRPRLASLGSIERRLQR